MTFSIVGRCAETGQLGIAISSSSIAVGARCPWLRSGVGAVSSQNITLPALGPQVLDGLGEGLAPAQALDQALTRNGYSQYRQVAVVDAQGRTALFSGNHALGINNAVAGEQCVAAGNLLANSAVIERMVEAFESSEGCLAARLLSALQAGQDAGARRARCIRRRCRWSASWSGRSSTCGWTGPRPTPSASCRNSGAPTSRSCRTT
ncbi:hypothetical protein C4K09_3240 [Pseudomonas chlororaphis subsp. aureofaciens]|nr:hypothetical protein C4K09_3240 [Pseudomonas chlororaphis subsp. aureofaciens]